MSEEVLLARAYLSRVTEPASVPVWSAVCERGPVAVAAEIASGRADEELRVGTGPRLTSADPAADLEVAQRHGVRLVVPESDEWPHFALSGLEAAGERRLARWNDGDHAIADYGEPVPPLALWVRGGGALAELGVRSVAIVGSRASTAYGVHVAGDLAAALARREFTVVSGGAHGIDAAAHRAALAVGAPTVIVSAGGLDRAPPANSALFDLAAADGLVVSESPPGSAPQRRRFLTRNRLIAAFGAGSIVVEAALRSGAMNTAGHARRLGRPVMAVPGPVTSTMSAGCHVLLRAEHDPALLVTDVHDVLAIIGRLSDLDLAARPRSTGGTALQRVLDDLDPASRRVFDGMPTSGVATVDALARAAGLPLASVRTALPNLHTRGLVVADGAGHRLPPTVRTLAMT